MCCGLPSGLLHPDENHVESEETLLNRQAFLHNE
jgi:hypothetical protein